MKVSLNWIKDYVKLPEDMDLTRLAYDLTMSTVEVEGAEDLAKRFEHMLVGVVTEVCPHPNADKLRICKTDIGGGDIREIVCGGTNLTAGMRVAVACPGALCRWHGEGEPVEIKEIQAAGRQELRHDLRRRRKSVWGICSPPTRRPTFWISAPLTYPPARSHCRRAGSPRHHSGDRQQVHDQPPRPVGPLRSGP